MTLISQSLDGKRVGYKGNVYVAVPDGMTPDDALARLERTPALLPDNVREAVDKKSMAIHAAELNLLNLYGEDRGDKKDYNAMTLLGLYRKAVERWAIALNTPAPTTGQRKETDEQ